MTSPLTPWEIFTQHLPEAKSLVGVLFAVFGNMMISVAINVQKYAHNRLQKELSSPLEKPIIASSVAGDLADAAASKEFRRVLGDDSDNDSDNEPFRLTTNAASPPMHNISSSLQSAVPPSPVVAYPQLSNLPSTNANVILEPQPPPFSTVVNIQPPLSRNSLSEDVGDTSKLLSKHTHTGAATGGKESSGSEEEYDDEDLDDDEEDDPSHAGGHNYLKSKWWWLGMTLMVSGEVGNFMAYGYAPASVVAPLGTVALISNAILAPVMLKEKFRGRDLLGILCAISGAVVVVASSKAEEVQLDPEAINHALAQPKFLIYTAAMIMAAGCLAWLSDRIGEKHVVVDLGLVAIFGGYTVLSTKAISSLLGLDFFQMFTYSTTYLALFVLVTTAVLQIKYLNKALQRFDSTEVIPTQFVLFTLAAIAGGGVMYNDFEKMDSMGSLAFISGCALTFLGVYFITSKREKKAVTTQTIEGVVAPIASAHKPSIPRGAMYFDENRRRNLGGSYGEYEMKGWGSTLDEDEESDVNGEYGRRYSTNHNALDSTGWRRQWTNTGGSQYGNVRDSTDSLFAKRGAVFWGAVRNASDRAKWWIQTFHLGNAGNSGNSMPGAADLSTFPNRRTSRRSRQSRQNSRSSFTRPAGNPPSRRASVRTLPVLDAIAPLNAASRGGDSYRRLPDVLDRV